jgi:hypothetical protein
MRLQLFGFEVYAAIDGYSRFIVWLYVGVSARTETSVGHQYLTTCGTLGYLPRVVRSDLGSEICFMGDSHWALRRANEPEVTHSDCYWIGRSVDNQRIESWWSQLSKSAAYIYYVSINP